MPSRYRKAIFIALISFLSSQRSKSIQFPAHMDEFRCCTAGAVGPFAKLTALGFSDGSIQLSTSAPENSVVTLYWHRLSVLSLDFGLVGGIPVLASAGADNLVVIWKPSKTKWKPEGRFEFDHECTSVSFSKNSGLLAVGLASGVVEVYDFHQSEEAIARIRRRCSGPVLIGWLPDVTDRIVVGDSEGNVAIVTLKGGDVTSWSDESSLHGTILSIAVSKRGLIAALYEKGYTKIIQKEVIGEIETSADISAVGCFWNQITDSLCFIGEHSEVIAWMQVGESAWRKMF